MKFKNVLWSLLAPIVLIGCSSSYPKYLAKTESEVKQQHFELMTLASLYYCDHQHWPHDLIELKQFAEDQKLISGIEIDWRWVLGSTVRYSTKPSLSLKSLSSDGRGVTRELVSSQDIPTCGQGRVNTQLKLQN